jgi:ribosome biogenesis GTPase
MRELGLIDADDGLGVVFDDIERLAQDCRFNDCGHGGEPGCAVRGALESGDLDAGRWEHFQKLGREVAAVDSKQDRATKDAERRRLVAIQKTHRSSKKIRRDD